MIFLQAVSNVLRHEAETGSESDLHNRNFQTAASIIAEIVPEDRGEIPLATGRMLTVFALAARSRS